jgi:hypothetical protein
MVTMTGGPPPLFLQGPPPHIMFNPNYPMLQHATSTMARQVSRKPSIHHSNTLPHQRSRKRRKSDSDLEKKANATYTGLDRSIADSFLEQQEKNQINHEKQTEDNKGSYDKYKDIQM